MATAVPLALPRTCDVTRRSVRATHVPHGNWLTILGATASVGISIVVLELIRLGRPSQAPPADPAVRFLCGGDLGNDVRAPAPRQPAPARRRDPSSPRGPRPGRERARTARRARALVGADVAWIVLAAAEQRRVGAGRLDRAGGSLAAEGMHAAARPGGGRPRGGRSRAAARGARSRRDRRPAWPDVRSRPPRAISIPLRGEAGVNGLLLVGNREGSATGYRSEDVRLLETFAGNAAVMLENDRLERSISDLSALKEQFHRQAHHDSLTALPNRALFARSVAAAVEDSEQRIAARRALPRSRRLQDDQRQSRPPRRRRAARRRRRAGARRRAGRRPTGQARGRRVRGADSRRLERGGREVAERLVETLEAPFTIAGREVWVHASVGIAHGGPGATSADELLRNADVAMYNAKRAARAATARIGPRCTHA